MNCCSQNIVKPPNKGHVGDGHFVPCREVVLFSEVLFWKFPKDKNNTILIYSASFDGLFNSKMARATLYYSIEYVQINIRSLFVTAFARKDHRCRSLNPATVALQKRLTSVHIMWV